MKFSCTQENLKSGLLVVSHIAGKNINLPILNNVLIKIDKNNIQLITTDLEIGITCNIRGKVEREGNFAVSAKLLSDYISLLPRKRVDVELADEINLKIKCENYKTKIRGEESSEFPLIPEVKQEKFYSFDFEEFKRALTEVIFAVALDEVRIELSGVYFEFNKDRLILASTDSYRLSEKKIKYKNKPEAGESVSDGKKIIIPAKTIQEIIRISSISQEEVSTEKSAQEIKMFVNDNQILFSHGDIELVSRIIEGQYPDYKQIIPNVGSENKTIINLDRQELLRAIKASSLFSKSNINDVSLDFPAERKKAVISAVSGQVGESTIEMPVEIKGKDNDIVLNYRYLLDGLNNINSERVVLEIIDSNTPCLLKAEGEENYLYIIMPIKK